LKKTLENASKGVLREKPKDEEKVEKNAKQEKTKSS
jgi:hypothetical protein